MILKNLRLFVYDKNKRDLFYFWLIRTLHEDYVSIDRSTEGGYNLLLTFYFYEDLNEEVDSLIQKILLHFKQIVPVKDFSNSEYAKYAIIMNKLSKMEERKKTEKIYREGEYIIENSSIMEFEKRYKLKMEVSWKVLLLRKIFLKSLLPIIVSSEENKYYYFLGFLFITAQSFKTGISDGAISYRSNVEYYLKQLENIQIPEENKIKIMNDILSPTLEERTIENKIQNLFFGNSSDKNDEIFSSFKKYLHETKNIIREGYRENLEYVEELPTASNFFGRVQQPSDFHKEFYKLPEIVEIYSQKDFVIHRYILTKMYELFPLANIGNITKQKLIARAATIIEKNTNRDWKQIIIHKVRRI